MGVPKPPAYTDSVERDLVEFSLLQSGVSITTPYSPRHTQTKSGGVWADSALSDGRTPLVLNHGNVTETVNLQLSFSNMKQLNEKLAQLGRLEGNCKRFLTTHSQIEPVYIKYKYDSATPEQYALLFNMDIEVTYNDNSQTGQNADAVVTISWEREMGWRAIPLGVSPAYYARLADGEIPGTNFDYTDIRPTTRTSAHVGAIFANRLNFDTSGLDVPVLTFSESSATWDATNAVTVPKEDIVGDLPALLSVGFRFKEEAYRKIYIGHSITERLPNLAGDATSYHNRYIQNAGDATDETTGSYSATWVSGSGTISNAQTSLKYAVDLSIPTGALSDTGLLSWGTGSAGSAGTLDYQLMSNAFRGKFAVFLRAKVTSGTPSDVQLYARFSNYTNASTVVADTNLNPAPSPVALATSATNAYGVMYLGSVSLPVGDRVRTFTDFNSGVGLYNFADMAIELRHVARAGGSPVTVQVCDLIMIPYDMGMVEVDTSWATDTVLALGNTLLADETSYINHGHPALGVKVKDNVGLSSGISNTRSFPRLIPNENNYLHFLLTQYDESTGEVYSTPDATLETAINIVPRWRGVRDGQ